MKRPGGRTGSVTRSGSPDCPKASRRGYGRGRPQELRASRNLVRGLEVSIHGPPCSSPIGVCQPCRASLTDGNLWSSDQRKCYTPTDWLRRLATGGCELGPAGLTLLSRSRACGDAPRRRTTVTTIHAPDHFTALAVRLLGGMQTLWPVLVILSCCLSQSRSRRPVASLARADLQREAHRREAGRCSDPGDLASHGER
jgi:hypothetical protein